MFIGKKKLVMRNTQKNIVVILNSLFSALNLLPVFFKKKTPPLYSLLLCQLLATKKKHHHQLSRYTQYQLLL